MSSSSPPPSAAPPAKSPPSTPAPTPPSDSTSPPAPSPTTPPSPSASSPSSPPPPAANSTSPPSIPPPSAKTPPSPPSHHSPPPPSPHHSGPPPPSTSLSTPLIVGISIGAVAALLLLLLSLLCVCCRRKKRRRPSPHHHFPYPPPPPPPLKDDEQHAWNQHPHNAATPDHVTVKTPPPPMSSGSIYSGSDTPLPPPPPPGMSFGNSRSTFTYEELAMATNGFSEANLLGQGGFGYVHKGVLPNGKEVAVKQLKADSGQGEREFHAEVEIISRVHHKHLVSLVGYCISGGQSLLVYEFVQNDTLEFHLHGKDRPAMDWPTRLKIALGSAKGLAYLHEDCHPKIIHRDIKGANILLDTNFEAKVADFGLAKFTSDNNTHVSTRVMGTFGYMAPEYASSGKLTDRSDVFSFGVMLLELITGRRPVDSTQSYMDDSLVDWAKPLLTRALDDGNYDALVDPRLGNNYNHAEMGRMISAAAACVRHSARHRPRMSQIVRALEGDMSLEDLNEGVRPGHSRPYGSYSSSDYESGQYNEDMKNFRKMVLASQDCASNEYGAPTSEYGQNPSASSNEGQEARQMEMGKTKKSSHVFSSSS